LVNNLEHKRNEHWSEIQKGARIYYDAISSTGDNISIDKEIIIHIGQHKTGSTAIQRCAVTNKDKNFIYPETGRLYAGHHAISRILSSSDAVVVNKFIDDFILEVEGDDKQYVLISSEFLSSENELVFNEKKMRLIWSNLARIVEKFKKSTVVYYMREQSIAIESRINQAIKSRICLDNTDVEIFIKNRSLDYSWLNSTLSEYFNTSKIVPVVYERSNFKNGDVCQSFFLDFFRIELEYSDSNPRLDKTILLRMFLKVNNLQVSANTKMKLKSFIDKLKLDDEKRTILTVEDVNKIINHYFFSNKKFFKETKLNSFSNSLSTSACDKLNDNDLTDDTFYQLLMGE
jgi:tRNA threonylcarbamoyladenosine modification (KEOPS) complex  Pcc1 subunit